MREAIIRWFSDSLVSIHESYFRLVTMDGPKVRERVFCYELYHILRTRQATLPFINELTLNGEIDKSGHSEFDDFEKNPDFVFHHPGVMNQNTCVIEVKGKIETDKIEKDFKTILTFVGTKQYQQGLFILYNHTMRELKEKFPQAIFSYPQIIKAPQVDILCIRHSRAVPEHATLDSFLQEQHR